jgi:hypothetical protein
MEKYNGERRIAKLLREFDKSGMETELFEESRYAPAPWQTKPMSQKYFKNALQRGCKIENQTLEDIEHETVDYISPDAKTDIELEISKM